MLATFQVLYMIKRRTTSIQHVGEELTVDEDTISWKASLSIDNSKYKPRQFLQLFICWQLKHQLKLKSVSGSESRITSGEEHNISHNFFTTVGMNFYTTFCFNQLHHKVIELRVELLYCLLFSVISLGFFSR